jgi:hypothetical protein
LEPFDLDSSDIGRQGLHIFIAVELVLAIGSVGEVAASPWLAVAQSLWHSAPWCCFSRTCRTYEFAL